MFGHWLGSFLLVLLIAVPASLAQAPEQADPSIEVEAAEITDLVIPLGERADTPVEVRVGCLPGEPPGTLTTAKLSIPEPAGYEDPVISPATLTWVTQAGDCPSLGSPFVANATLSLALTQSAPGFQEQALPIEAVVEKHPVSPMGPNQTYGPAMTDVTYTPGYFNLYNVRLEEKIQQVDAGETAVYQATIDNFSNHETRFEAAVADAPDGVAVAIEPEVLVLAPNGTGAFEVAVSLDGPISRIVNDVATVQISVDSNTTHPLGGEGASSQVSTLTQFRRIPGDDIPGIGPWMILGLVAVTAVAVTARRRSR